MSTQEPPTIIDAIAKMVNDIIAGIAGTPADIPAPKTGCGCQANKGQ